MRSFEIGILGCGVISRTYISDIQRFFPHLHIRACADVRTEVAQKTCEEYEIAYAYTVEELLKDEKIEIVINLTPPQFHVELNKKILLAGKHVFTEKPFARRIRFWHPDSRVFVFIWMRGSSENRFLQPRI